MSDTLRAFIAIELSEEIKSLIEKVQNDLRASDCAVKWVRPQNNHVTLKFLGQVADENIKNIQSSLSELVRSTHPFTFELTHLGGFPSIKNPRVLWIGIEDKNAIEKLVIPLEEKMSILGFEKEDRKFTPHITIGRIKSLKNIKHLSETLQTYAPPQKFIQNVSCITLFKSTLTKAGAIHEALEKFEFATT